MYRTSLAAAMAVAGLAFAAPPAVAQAPFNGPNCSGGVVSNAVIGIGAKEAAASSGLTIQEAHELIQAACADITTTVPRCEIGHGQAAQEALARGDLDQYFFHLGALFRCFVGEPPGPPL
jgi:hypothetical protein